MISHVSAAAKPTPFQGCGSRRRKTNPTSSASTDSLYLKTAVSLGRVGRYAEEDSDLQYLSQHASVISVGAALVSVVLARSLLRMFKLTLILGGMGGLAYLVILRR